METIKNTSAGTIGFGDDDRKDHILKPGETVECNYKFPVDKRFVIIDKKKKKKEMK